MAYRENPVSESRQKRRVISLRACFALVILCVPSTCGADSDTNNHHGGVDELLFGMSTALTGPAAELGINVRAGVEAAFLEANSVGGIHGKKLRLIALDDGYEPNRTAPNMHELITERGVLGVIGNVGTPTAVVSIPIAVDHQTLFFGAYTGAGVLRKSPPDRYVINYRASYAEETGAMVDGLVEELGLRPEEIAFFTQRDAYGDAGYSGGVEALKRHGLKHESDIAHGRYERNTVVVENGLADVLMADPPAKAVIMVGAYRPCASFIELASSSGLEAIYLNVSFVGAEPLRQALGPLGEGVVVTQVVPHYQSQLPIVSDYRQAMEQYNDSLALSFGSLEGYVSARILIKAINELEGEITRESIVDALERLGEFDLGIGEKLLLSPSQHQASHRVWPTVIRQGRLQPLTWNELLRGPGD